MIFTAILSFFTSSIIQLTKEQDNFLKKHRIPLNWIMDVTGIILDKKTGEILDISKYGDFRFKYNKKKVLETIKKYDKHFLFNWKNCQKDENHNIRDKYRCVECNTYSIGEVKKHNNKGFIYIAISKSENIVKIGLTGNIEDRKRTLNETNYGGISDWQIVYHINSLEKAGEIESKTQNLLSKYICNAEYLKNGRKQSTYELVKCSYKTAKFALDEIKSQYPNDIFTNNWEMSNAEQLFNFENVETNTKR